MAEPTKRRQGQGSDPAGSRRTLPGPSAPRRPFETAHPRAGDPKIMEIAPGGIRRGSDPPAATPPPSSDPPLPRGHATREPTLASALNAAAGRKEVLPIAASSSTSSPQRGNWGCDSICISGHTPCNRSWDSEVSIGPPAGKGSQRSQGLQARSTSTVNRSRNGGLMVRILCCTEGLAGQPGHSSTRRMIASSSSPPKWHLGEHWFFDRVLHWTAGHRATAGHGRLKDHGHRPIAPCRASRTRLQRCSSACSTSKPGTAADGPPAPPAIHRCCGALQGGARLMAGAHAPGHRP